MFYPLFASYQMLVEHSLPLYEPLFPIYPLSCTAPPIGVSGSIIRRFVPLIIVLYLHILAVLHNTANRNSLIDYRRIHFPYTSIHFSCTCCPTHLCQSDFPTQLSEATLKNVHSRVFIHLPTASFLPSKFYFSSSFFLWIPNIGNSTSLNLFHHPYLWSNIWSSSICQVGSTKQYAYLESVVSVAQLTRIHLEYVTSMYV